MPHERQPTVEDHVLSDLTRKRMLARILEVAETPEDVKVLKLMIDGERSTDLYADALGLQDLGVDQRRREVKRHKDRLKKRLERLGLTTGE